ncbi:MAG: preprotein translocase subunit SecG [Thermodesulfobacteriota bacterium]|nr:preprotein translocase subunit SecG [Thermodesulfobacteriota bacterium]
MTTFIVILHVAVSLALIFIVLLQTGKGASMGATFGGGSSQTVFGSQGASSFLGKITAIAAIVFMLTSLSMSLFSSGRIGGESIMEGIKQPVQEETAAPAPAPGADTQGEPEMPREQAQPIQPAPGEE